MRELNALRNMPIWIDRCRTRSIGIKRIEGVTPDYQQILVLRDYMLEVTR
jgi:hypothetical protein